MSKPRKPTKQTNKQRQQAFTNARINLTVATSKARKPYTEPWETKSFVGCKEPVTRLGVFSANAYFYGPYGRARRHYWDLASFA